jgi:CheY-like chemotaxis protein
MPRRILVADDSAVARLALTRKLRAAGLEVIERASAAEAKRVTSDEIACALLDLDLGDGEGTDVADALRGGEGDLPIAFFTASSSDDAIERALERGPVFRKPEELESAVHWVLRNATR